MTVPLSPTDAARQALAESVYVASSWRNNWLDLVNADLRAAGFATYDFREADGFHWSDVFPDWEADWPNDGAMSPHMLKEGLRSGPAQRGFARDIEALDSCAALVMVLPCGNSAHLEIGYAAGAGKPTAVLLPPDHSAVRPDLMWKVADLITPEIGEVIAWASAALAALRVAPQEGDARPGLIPMMRAALDRCEREGKNLEWVDVRDLRALVALAASAPSDTPEETG